MEINKEIGAIHWGYNYQLTETFYPAPIRYGVMVTYFKGEQTDTIKYEMGIKKIKLDNLFHLVEIDRLSGIWINDREPDLMAYELGALVSAVLYPLSLTIESTGKIVKVSNFKEIQKRWEQKKSHIRESYEGDVLEKYLSLAEKSFDREDILLNRLKNDWFLSSFFNSIYINYTQEHSVVQKHTFPFIFNSKQVEYEVMQKIGKDTDDPDYVIVEMNGQLTDKRSLADLKNGLDFPLYGGRQAEGTYVAKYYLDSKSHGIDTYLFECSMNLNIDRKVSIVVARLNAPESGIEMSGKGNEKEAFWQKVKRFFS